MAAAGRSCCFATLECDQLTGGAVGWAAGRPPCLAQNANKLRVLPPSIGALTAMIRLSLHINNLAHLPPEIGNLVHLEALR